MNRAPDPGAAIGAFESSAKKVETPCAAGRMVWRNWGEGRPVLLLHGGSGSWLHWLKTIPALTPRYAVWAPDMPGFGDSDLPPEPYALDSYAGAVASGLERVLPESGPFDVAAFSLGASIAARIALRFQGRVRHLVLSGANFLPPVSGRKFDLVSVKRAADATERLRAVRHNIKIMMLAHEQSIDPLALHLYELDTARRKLPRISFSGFSALRTDLTQVRLQGRLSAISGAEDQVIGQGPEAQAVALRALRSDAQYRAIAGSGHWVMYEAADRYNEVLLGALSESGV